jgi:hypothetical protein
VSVSIVDNTAYIKAKVSSGIPLALRFALDDIHRIANPRTPMQHGNLRAEVTKTVVGKIGTITWHANYAIYQEKKRFSNYTTPGTGPNYAENSVTQIVGNFNTYLQKAGIK